MARNDPELRVRIPEDVQTELQAAAKANGRTLTAEVLARLVLPSTPIEEQIEDLERLKAMLDHQRMSAAAYEDYIHALKSGISMLGEIIGEIFTVITKNYQVSEEVQKRWAVTARLALELADRPARDDHTRMLKPREVIEKLNRIIHSGAAVSDSATGTAEFMATAAAHLQSNPKKVDKP